MVDTGKIMARVCALGLDGAGVSRRLGWTLGRWERSMHYPERLHIEDIRRISHILNISAAESDAYFFANKVAKRNKCFPEKDRRGEDCVAVCMECGGECYASDVLTVWTDARFLCDTCLRARLSGMDAVQIAHAMGLLRVRAGELYACTQRP